MEFYLTATECHLPYGSHNITFHPTQVKTPRLKSSQQADTRFTYPEGWKAELPYVTGYIPRRFICPHAVTHPSSNWAQCRLTTLIEANVLTTTLRRI